MVTLRLKSALVIALALAASIACADTLELKNGSVIKGRFLGGTASEISFQVGSTVQEYNVADIVSLKFDSEGAAPAATPGATSGATPDTTAATPPPDVSSSTTSTSPSSSALPDDPGTVANVQPKPANLTIPAGTRISVRTIDSIDSSYNVAGDRFQASLAEPLIVDDNLVVPKDALVYGRLTQSKESGTFTGRSQLRLELIGIVVNGKMLSIVTGECEVNGKSRGASTAKRTAAGAALGAIIGAAADGGQGAAIGAGAGAGAGAASEVIIGSEQVKVPSETFLDFTLEQDVTIPNRAS
jgi:hypothetical protein